MHANHNMIGESPAMAKVYRFVAQVAPSDSTVLIAGESGTGKELVARALHRNSPRATKPLVAINCAALTENLLEDELFGHERGAFTGAIAQKKGKFEMADGGTLFLDEVGELAPNLQAKLLRVLQEREFDRVGGTRPIRVDVRIVAATNLDLEAAVKATTFRQDLFFRLNVVRIMMPALRERPEDIPSLASHFSRKLSPKTKRRISGISHAAEAALCRYDWPGNVRELENAIERAMVLGSGDLLLPEDLPESILDAATTAQGAKASAGSEYLGDFQMSVTESKRKAVCAALERAGGVYTEAAKILGVHPNYLHRLVNNLGLR
jgi:transcriptional regulator with GAF, ATPase, and Fis domain